jgi:hypothetical protein
MTTATSDTFVPLVTTPTPSGETGAFCLKVLPQAEARSVFAPLPDAASPALSAKACGRPTVTLQRQGEIVSGIRIECGCGQVIELACTY